MKFKVKVPIAGQEQEHEVDLDIAALGLLPKDEVTQRFMPKDVFESELDRRVKSLTKGKFSLEDLGKNPELKDQILEALGMEIVPDDEGDEHGLTADDLARVQEEWRMKELGPVAERAEKAEKRVSKLLERILVGEIVQGAIEARVMDHLLKPLTPDAKPPIVSLLGDVFGYDEEHDDFFVKKGEGFDFSSDPKTTGKPYKGVREFLSGWAADKNNAPFINLSKPGGSRLGQPSKDGSGVAVIDAPTDRPLTLQEYKAAQEAAGAGGSVVVKSAGAGNL